MHRILCIGDIHFKTDDEDAELFIEACVAAIKNYEKLIDVIVVMGDILDKHERAHMVPYMRSIRFLKACADVKPTYLLIGNHDRMNNSDFCSPCHFFVGLSYPNLFVVDSPRTLMVGKCKYIFVPYVPPGRFREAMSMVCDFDHTTHDDKIPIEDVTMIFAHQEFAGVNMNNIVSISGDPWSENMPFVASGHIHKFQRLRNNIVYVGTPRQINFGECDDTNKKLSIFICNEETGKREPKRTTIDLNMPRYRTVRCDISELEDLEIEDPSSKVRVMVSCDPETRASSIFAITRVRLLKSKGVIFNLIPVRKQPQRSSDVNAIQTPKFEETFLERLGERVKETELADLFKRVVSSM